MGFRSTSVWILLVSLALGLAFEGAEAQSNQYKRKAAPQAAKSGKAGAKKGKKSGDKLDISDLSKKYWAPKDTDFSVVQNRSYSKAKRWSGTLMYGRFVNETFAQGDNLALGVNYYFSERHGVGVNYVNANSTNSKTTDTFIDELGGGSVAPDYNRPTDYFGVSYNWVPFYAKMSVLGKKIIYFDMQISPGLASTSYEQLFDEDGDNVDPTIKTQSAIALTLDVTQFFFFSKNLALRADLRNRWYKQEVLNYRTGDKEREETANVSTFLLGVTYFY